MGYYDNEKYLINLMEKEIQDKFSEIEKALDEEIAAAKDKELHDLSGVKKIWGQRGRQLIINPEYRKLSFENKRIEELKQYTEEDRKKELEAEFELAKEQILSRWYRSIDPIKYHLESKYHNELKIIRDKYPMDWMREDNKILKTFKRYPLFIPFLNYLYNETRWYDHGTLTGTWRQTAEKKLGDIRYISDSGKEYEYAIFHTEDHFYAMLTYHLNCTKGYAQKFLQRFNEIGIIKHLGNYKKNIRIYADGYYTPWKERKKSRLIKRSFVKKDRHFIQNFRDFKI